MELNIIHKSADLQELKYLAENYLDCELRYIEIEMSMFEQYRIYPKEKRVIPKLWTYRIIKNNGVYYFGNLK